MKLLITGGAGFMGSNFVHHILKKYPDYQIVNLDKLTYAGNLDNLKDIENNPNYTFTKGNIADIELVDKLCEEHKFDAILNYAAETHVDRSIIEPDAFIKTNVYGSYSLLEAAKKHNIKMIQVSTDEVFGVAHGEDEFFEDTPFDPTSPYSAAKAGGDMLCRAYSKTYDTPVIVTHCCNFFGPYQYPEKLFPLFITNLLEDKKVPVYGDGKQVREWIFTEDHCNAIDTILHKGKVGEVYNIGTTQRKENIEITKLILKELGKDESSIEYVKDRAGHDVRYAVNSDKLRSELDWKPNITFEEGIKRTVQWYKDNEEWWKKLKSKDFEEYYRKQYKDR